ncbi:hypothetical protein [Weissella coleopterorum]|nr:hypothetical protein [Weissella coleopterorum]
MAQAHLTETNQIVISDEFIATLPDHYTSKAVEALQTIIKACDTMNDKQKLVFELRCLKAKSWRDTLPILGLHKSRAQEVYNQSVLIFAENFAPIKDLRGGNND